MTFNDDTGELVIQPLYSGDEFHVCLLSNYQIRDIDGKVFIIVGGEDHYFNSTTHHAFVSILDSQGELRIFNKVDVQDISS